MRPSVLLGIAAAVLALVAACGSSGGSQTRPPSIVSTSVSAPTSAPNGTTSTTASGVNPGAAEINPSGDIPDNQVFVKYTSRDGKYALVVPEGWARTARGGATTFADHFNSIHIDTTRGAAPTVATARATEVPVLRRDASGFALGNVVSVSRSAGVVVLVTYRATSAADAVTGKRVALDVERYEFWRNGTQVTITLSAPQGSDNVDPWKKVTESFAWTA
jgi:hypothetical protein